MSKRKYELGSFVPCSRKHYHCSPAHAQLVAGYRVERERQLMLFEAETGNYEGDKKLWKENGKKLITFKMWLKASKKSHDDSAILKKEKSKTTLIQSEVDKIFNQLIPAMNTPDHTTEIGTNEDEEECNCDCDVCCRNDHIACEHACESGPEYVQHNAGTKRMV